MSQPDDKVLPTPLRPFCPALPDVQLQLCAPAPALLEGLSAAANSTTLQGPSFPALAHPGRGGHSTGLCFWLSPSETRVLGTVTVSVFRAQRLAEADLAGEQSRG